MVLTMATFWSRLICVLYAISTILKKLPLSKRSQVDSGSSIIFPLDLGCWISMCMGITSIWDSQPEVQQWVKISCSSWKVGTPENTLVTAPGRKWKKKRWSLFPPPYKFCTSTSYYEHNWLFLMLAAAALYTIIGKECDRALVYPNH